jgi:hypothetical protein
LTERPGPNPDRSNLSKLCWAVILVLVGVGPGVAALADQAEAIRREVTMQLKTEDYQPLGSAVVVQAAQNGYWLVTSRHVVQAIHRLCVVPFAGPPQPAQVMPLRTPSSRLALDLALVWQPASRAVGPVSKPRQVARLVTSLPVAANFQVVTASGYPTLSSNEQSSLRYIESTGLLMPLLEKTIEGGFDVASTVSVTKGMSGGGLFLGERLLAINGIHAHPLWSGTLLDADGQPLKPDLNLKLEQLSLSISASAVQRLLEAAMQPSAQDLKGIETLRCGQPKAPASQPQAVNTPLLH